MSILTCPSDYISCNPKKPLSAQRQVPHQSCVERKSV
ncbi:hypothetical protein ERS069962_01705, partial [Streptococcus pneumoniae]